jgi:hypothetical protein
MTLRDGNWSNAARRLGLLVDRFDGRLPSEAPLFSRSRNLVGLIR